jgi:hypothetical protein
VIQTGLFWVNLVIGVLVPSVNMVKIIKNWSLVPGKGTVHLYGDVYGDERFADGATIETSPIVGLNPLQETVVTKSGNEYMLGRPNDKYEEAYPDAKKQFLDNLFEAMKKKMIGAA